MNKPADHFSGQAAKLYDERNRALLPIFNCMHFLIRLGLQDAPPVAHVLCVGVGTGAEILQLAETFPGWTFVGLDPSASMLEVCRERLAQAGVLERCQLLNGYVQDAPTGETFDIAMAVLVAHFVPRAELLDFFTNMTTRLKPGGQLVTTQISSDLDAASFPEMMKNWGRVQALMGATPDSLANLPRLLRDMLTVLPHEETETILRQSGIAHTLRFFQALMITGWMGRKV